MYPWKGTLQAVKTQISLCICPFWSILSFLNPRILRYLKGEKQRLVSLCRLIYVITVHVQTFLNVPLHTMQIISLHQYDCTAITNTCRNNVIYWKYSMMCSQTHLPQLISIPTSHTASYYSYHCYCVAFWYQQLEVLWSDNTEHFTNKQF